MFKIVYTSLSFSESRYFATGFELQPNWSAGFWSVTSLPWNSKHHFVRLMENLSFQEVNTSTVHPPFIPFVSWGELPYLKGVGAANPKCLKTHPMERKVLVCHSQSLYRIRRSSPQLRYQVLQFICISCGHLVLLGNKTVVHNQCNFGSTNARMWEPSFKKQHRILIKWKYCSDSFNIWG